MCHQFNVGPKLCRGSLKVAPHNMAFYQQANIKSRASRIEIQQWAPFFFLVIWSACWRVDRRWAQWSERSEVVVVVIMILWYRLKRAFWFLGKPRGVVFEGNMQMVKFFTAHLIALMKVFALFAWICFSYWSVKFSKLTFNETHEHDNSMS